MTARISPLSLLIAIILLVDNARALTPLLQTGCGTSLPLETCLNLGASATTVGKYLSDDDRVKYRKSPSFIPYDGTVAGADEPGAYATLVRKKSVRFYVEVPKKHRFDVTIGMVDYESCDNPKGNQIKFTVGNQKLTENPVLTTGCNTAAQITLTDVNSNKRGRISFKIKGKRPVTVATVCVTRHLAVESSSCSTAGCVTYDGCTNYAVINATLAIPGPPCDVNPSGFAKLSLPTGSVVRHAVLQWAGAGHPGEATTGVTLNGIPVTSTLLYENGEFEPYYGAIAADVTDIVRQFGIDTDYAVSGIFQRKFHSCPQAHISAWSLTVVYEHTDLPYGRVNMCAQNTRSTSQQLDYTIGCMDGDVANVEAKSTLVGIETDMFTERLSINDKVVGFGLFQEYAGEGFDVVEVDIKPYLTSGTTSLKYSFVDNPAHDSLIVAVMNTYQTINEQR